MLIIAGKAILAGMVSIAGKDGLSAGKYCYPR
jgi:hypothetical protein